MQGFRGTICTVKEAKYLVNKINGIEPVEVKEADAALLQLQEKVEAIIRSLTWQDFEMLIDLIFRQAGWQRVSVLGGTMKTLDLELISPITNERYGVQVKAKADLSVFEKYKMEGMNDMQGFTKFYFGLIVGGKYRDGEREVASSGGYCAFIGSIRIGAVGN